MIKDLNRLSSKEDKIFNRHMKRWSTWLITREMQVKTAISAGTYQNQFSSLAQLCLTLCNPMDCSGPGFPVYQQLLELTQTHIHQIGGIIQPSHLLSSPSPPTFNFSQ